MAEPGAETPKELTCFPITTDAVTRTLAEIAADPQSASLEEGTIIKEENPELNDLLFMRLRGAKAGSDFIEGALWTHRILRKRAQLNGTNLPKLTPDSSSAYFQERLEVIQGTGISFRDETNNQYRKLANEEPELDKGLQEMLKYRANRTFFQAGVCDVYFAIKRTLQSIKLARDLKYE